MDSIETKITSKGQISVPSAVRRRLGVVPGGRLEWLDRDGEVVVRRASRYTSQEINEAVFGTAPRAASVEIMDAGIRQHLKRKHARR